MIYTVNPLSTKHGAPVSSLSVAYSLHYTVRYITAIPVQNPAIAIIPT